MAAENNGGTLGTKISADFFVLEYSFFSRSYFSMRSVLVTACGCAVRKGKMIFTDTWVHVGRPIVCQNRLCSSVLVILHFGAL